MLNFKIHYMIMSYSWLIVVAGEHDKSIAVAWQLTGYAWCFRLSEARQNISSESERVRDHGAKLMVTAPKLLPHKWSYKSHTLGKPNRVRGKWLTLRFKDILPWKIYQENDQDVN